MTNQNSTVFLSSSLFSLLERTFPKDIHDLRQLLSKTADTVFVDGLDNNLIPCDLPFSPHVLFFEVMYAVARQSTRHPFHTIAVS